MLKSLRTAFKTFRGLRALTAEVKGIREELSLIRRMMQHANLHPENGSSFVSLYEGMEGPEVAEVLYVNDVTAFQEEAYIREKEEELGRPLLPQEIENFLKRKRES